MSFVAIVLISVNESGTGAIFAPPVFHFPTIPVQRVNVTFIEKCALPFCRHAKTESSTVSCHTAEDEEIEKMASARIAERQRLDPPSSCCVCRKRILFHSLLIEKLDHSFSFIN